MDPRYDPRYDPRQEQDKDPASLRKIKDIIRKKISDLEEKASLKGNIDRNLNYTIDFLTGVDSNKYLEYQDVTRFIYYADKIDRFLKSNLNLEERYPSIKAIIEFAQEAITKNSNNSNEILKETINDLYLDILAVQQGKIFEREAIKPIYAFLCAHKSDYKSQGVSGNFGKMDKTMEEVIKKLGRILENPMNENSMNELNEIRTKISFQMTQMQVNKKDKTPLCEAFKKLTTAIDDIRSGKKSAEIKKSIDNNFSLKAENKNPAHDAAAGLGAGVGAGAEIHSEVRRRSKP